MGGGETSLLNHLKHMDRKRFQSLVVLPQSGPLTDPLSDMDIKYRIIPFPILKKVGKFYIRFPLHVTSKLYGLLKKEPFQIVHANGFNATAMAAPAAKLLGIPIICTCHGWWPTGKLTGAFINILVDKVVAVSNFVRSKLVLEGHVNPEKVVHIPLGIDPAEYDDNRARTKVRHALGFGENVPVVGMIARFQEIKGHHIFVNMANDLIKTYPETQFMIVGSEVFNNSKENEYHRKVEELIDSCNLRKKFLLTGFRSDVSQILKALDVLVVPSEIESFGMVVIEAMAAGVPVVCCAKGGPEDIIQDQFNGFLTNEQNPTTLAEKVSYLLDHPATAKIMGRRAISTVKSRFSLHIVEHMIEGLYSEMIHNRKICSR